MGFNLSMAHPFMKYIIVVLFVVVSQFSWLTELQSSPIEITGPPFTYKQDFASLGLNDLEWTNDATISGWFIKKSNVVLDEDFTIFASDGSIVQPASQLYNFGNNSDRALGAFGSDSFYYGALFTNTTAKFINKITVSYEGEQWRKSGDAVNSPLEFLYRIDGTKFAADNTGWTTVSNGVFTATQTAPVGPLNGNDAANRALITFTISDITIAPGQVFWVRWFDKDDFGVDQGLAFDNVSITFEEGVPSFVLELKNLNFDKVVSFKGNKGFTAKGRIRSSLSIEKLEYAVTKPNVDNLSLAYTTTDRLKKIVKGRLFRKGYAAKFKTRKRDNRIAQGTPAGTTSLTVVFKITGKTSNGVEKVVLIPTPLKTRVK